MKYSQAKQGRIFVIRLEDGEVVHEQIEKLAREQAVQAAMLIAVGGVDQGSRLIVGPEQARSETVVPLEQVLDNVHEIAGTGTLFPDDQGNPSVHMHMACGRQDSNVTGCIRQGVKVWHIIEVIMLELLDSSARRLPDQSTGFKLLVP